MQIADVTKRTKEMIDNLKAVCANYGLGNSGNEYKIITEAFLYKFLNDKFIYRARCVVPQFANMTPAKIDAAMSAMSDDDYELMLYDIGGSTAKLKREHYISYLFNHKGEDNFHTLFDDTLVDISNKNIAIFSVRAGGQSKISLFDKLSQYVIEEEKKDGFCSAIISNLAEFSFDSVFEQKYDFFSQIFEYLISDYNKDSGKYGEYYTPHSIASIIAQIMVPNGAKNVTIYDPAAGSGTLVLALAHEIGEDNCTIYTQDRSQKANEFLRLNLILNNLVHSLPNVVHDDTLLTPRHLNDKKDGVATFDYIVSNPPFGSDFSETRDTLAGEKYKKRFWAGVPNIPNKDKDKMAIYLMFLQHIIFSLKDTGKAAVVVPTGFLTAGASIQKKIRERLVDKHMLRGVISMPSNIFATTGTNVSILFIDSENADGKVVLMDASNLGTKVKLDGKNQKTVLSPEEIKKIIDTFNVGKPEDGFCVAVSYEDIKTKKYSFSAGQYFEANIDYSPLTRDEFSQVMNDYKSNLKALFKESDCIEKDLFDALESVKYDI